MGMNRIWEANGKKKTFRDSWKAKLFVDSFRETSIVLEVIKR